jgi:Phytanoyl-CoA dioxygenase (PhyH)
MTSVHVAEVIQQGYTVFQALLPDNSVSMLRDVVKRERQDQQIITLGAELFETYPEIILPLISSARVLETLELLVGPFVQLDSVSLVALSPHCEAAIGWHRDPYGSVPRGQEFQKPLALNLLVYLQDLTDDVGPLRVIAGSHRCPLVMSAEQRTQPHPAEEMVRARSGDGVLVHNNLVHSRSRNLSQADRMHVSIVYSLTCMRPWIDFEAQPLKAIRAEIRNSGNHRLMRLLGDDVLGTERYNDGFLTEEAVAWKKWIEEERSLSG